MRDCQLYLIQKLALPAEEKESHMFLFTGEDFNHIKNLIYRIAGISLAPSKKDLVYSRLARR